MRRRELIALQAGLATVGSVPGRAQQRPMPVIGYLHTASPDLAPTPAVFLEGLRDAGYVVGQNVAIEYRFAEGRYDRLPALAADLVARKVDVIVAMAPAPAEAAKKATSTIPIVFQVGNDPVATGLVASLARPGGNATGVSVLFTELTAKRFELLSELLPGARIFAQLVNPGSSTAAPTVRDAEEASRASGLQIPIVRAASESELDAAFASLAGLQVRALSVGADPFFGSRREQIVELARRHAMPTMYFGRSFTEDGGLISYGTNLTAVYRLVGGYAARILKGEKPADLPVQQPTTFELVVNLKAAKALGLAVPQALLARADEIID